MDFSGNFGSEGKNKGREVNKFFRYEKGRF